MNYVIVYTALPTNKTQCYNQLVCILHVFNTLMT